MAAVSMTPNIATSLNGIAKPMHMTDNDWNAKESQRQRELEEARARAAQMVKTMKWWSECTANWREKWIKVRNERNQARDELKQLRINLDAATKKAKSYKHEKQELELQVSQLKQEMEQVHALMMTHAGQFDKMETKTSPVAEEANNRDVNSLGQTSNNCLKNVNSEDGLVTKVEQNLKALDLSSSEKSEEAIRAEEQRLLQQLSKEDEFNEQYMLQKIARLESHLEQAEQIIKTEQNDKCAINLNLSKLQKENGELRERQEQLYASKQEAVRELLTIQELHRAEINIVNKALQEEMKTRENLEHKFTETRAELERLHQLQNEECCKMERLETEKLAFERRNKMLNTEVRYYQELFDHKGLPTMWRCERCGTARPSSGIF